MKVTTKQYAMALYQSLKEAPTNKKNEVIKNFVNVLANNHVLSKAPQIINDFKKFYNLAEGIITVDAQTASPISAEGKKEVINTLQKITGKKIELENTVDPELIGGLKLKFNDLVVDGSLKNNLNNLKQTINS